MTRLLAVPNVSEGRDHEAIAAIGRAFGGGLLDVHSDPDHHRTVFTVAGSPGELAEATAEGAAEAVRRIDLRAHEGLHPRVGAVDVAPIVYLSGEGRGAACAEALVLGDLLSSDLGLPVFLYGILGAGRTRAELRRGGPPALDARLRAGELAPDFGGPRELHRTAGATLLGARPPLVAFNIELGPPAGEAEARQIAALIREGGPEGLSGVKAIGLWLSHEQRAQVSTNVEDHRASPLADVVAAVVRHAEVATTELVGLAPRAAFAGFPSDVPVRNLRILEDVLARAL